MATKKTTEHKVSPAREPLMYVGPTASSLNAIQNVVYTEIPSAAKEAIAKSPLIGSLFIPVTEYPKAEMEIRTQTGAYWSAWNAALAYQNTYKNGGK